MDEPTAAELETLGARWGITVESGEAAALASAVADRLEPALERVSDPPPPVSPPATADRTATPGADPHNAIRTRCTIPPAAETGPLVGQTVGLKDNIAVAGVPMGCGSPVMTGVVPEHDATVVRLIRAAGGEITAKTTMDEFAGGGRGRTQRGLVANPRAPARIAGGSSGGSAAAVAAGLVEVALGTDTGGSVRKPASFCGLVGLKPSYGRVSLAGVVENTYTLDHVGTIARTVPAAATLLDVVTGPDPADPATGGAPEAEGARCGATARAPPRLDSLRVGIATAAGSDPLATPVRSAFEASLETLERAGLASERVTLPWLDVVTPVKNAISYAELAAFWRARGLGLGRGGWVPPADRASFAARAATESGQLNAFYRSRILTGAWLLETEGGRHYAQARAAAASIRRALVATLEPFDAILTPTVPRLAPTTEQVLDPSFDYDGLHSEIGIGRYTKLANVTGAPAITIPSRPASGPPVGLQLIGTPASDAALCGVAGRLAPLFDPEAASPA